MKFEQKFKKFFQNMPIWLVVISGYNPELKLWLVVISGYNPVFKNMACYYFREQPVFQNEENTSPKRWLFLAKGVVHPSVNYFIFMHPRSDVRFSASFLV